MFKKIAVLGPGLIGGSILKAVRLYMPSTQLCAWTPFEEELKKIGQKIFDLTLSLEEAVRDADLVIISTPTEVIEDIAQRVVPYLHASSMITDVGSVKTPIVEKLESIFAFPNGTTRYLSSHPMAGKEFGGFEYSLTDLFKDKTCILTPLNAKKSLTIQKAIEKFWKMLGINFIQILSPEEHDQVVARISHLPYLISVALMQVGANGFNALNCAGPGFDSATRLANQPPMLWAEILSLNRESILPVLEEVQVQIQKAFEFLKTNQKGELENYLRVAATQRQKFVDRLL